MTREEALQILDTIPTIGEQVDALEMAIEALSAEPCEDYIKIPKGSLKYADKDYVCYKREWLKKWWQPELALLGIELPSVQPIRPKGEWKHIFEWNEERVVCKRCGHTRTRLHGDILHFCPNCGADMRGTE